MKLTKPQIVDSVKVIDPIKSDLLEILKKLPEALSEVLCKQPQPMINVAAPSVNMQPNIIVNIEDKPKSWLFKIERDSYGKINTVKAETIKTL